MATTPIDLSTFDITKLTIDEPFEMTKGQKNKTRKCIVRYKGAPLVLQTPRLQCPFPFRDEPQETTISGAILTPDEPAQLKFRNVLVAIDEALQTAAEQRAGVWFSKQMSPDIIREQYKSPYKTPENYLPTFKMKFLRNEFGAGSFDVWNAKRELINIPLEKCFEKYAEIVCVVECTGIWLQPSLGWGCNWRVRMVKHYPPQRGYVFLDADEGEQEETNECALTCQDTNQCTLTCQE
jgi:hypothetical protein